MDGAAQAESARPASVSIDAAALDDACLGFDRSFPHRSARRVLTFVQIGVVLAAAAALVWAARQAPGLTLQIALGAAWAVFAAAVLWRLLAAAHLQPLLSRLAEPQRFPIYTVLCPLYREANVVADLVAGLDRLDFPRERLDIKLLVEADDRATVAAALALARPHIEVLVIPPARPRTKPKALNVGLARARGEYLVVYDAEDRPHPMQLRAALAAFEDGGPKLACVQAPLAVHNAHAAWIAGQFAAEYAIQFREMLPLLARFGLPMPLGGSSNHFRTAALRDSGGWDPFNVTEDAELGYRLAREGYRCGVIGPPTAEEAPVTFTAWLRQRTRWIKGHIQTWLVLMRDPAAAVREMGLAGFAAMQLTLAGGVAAALVHAPLAFIVLTAALSHYDLPGPGFALAISGYIAALFASLTASAVSGSFAPARAALTMPLYWPLSTAAALCALFELVLRPHHWAKTAHGVSPPVRFSDPAPTKRHVSAPIFAMRGRA